MCNAATSLEAVVATDSTTVAASPCYEGISVRKERKRIKSSKYTIKQESDNIATCYAFVMTLLYGQGLEFYTDEHKAAFGE